MFRTAMRNVLVMLGVAIPVLLVSAPLIGWLLPQALGGSRGGTPGPSLASFLAPFPFLYAIWAPPALGIAGIHQLVLAAFPRDWSARTTRLAIVGTSLLILCSIVSAAASIATHPQPLALGLALLPSAVVYGILAQPLRRPGVDEHR